MFRRVVFQMVMTEINYLCLLVRYHLQQLQLYFKSTKIATSIFFWCKEAHFHVFFWLYSLYDFLTSFSSWSNDLCDLYYRIFAGTDFCHWFVIGCQFMETNVWIFTDLTETKIFHLITKSDHSCIPPGLNHRSQL